MLLACSELIRILETYTHAQMLEMLGAQVDVTPMKVGEWSRIESNDVLKKCCVIVTSLFVICIMSLSTPFASQMSRCVPYPTFIWTKHHFFPEVVDLYPVLQI